MTLHVHAPPGTTQRRILRCPSTACRCRRRHIFVAFEWYDPIVTCCHCGFTRGLALHYRKQSPKRAAEARAKWAAA